MLGLPPDREIKATVDEENLYSRIEANAKVTREYMMSLRKEIAAEEMKPDEKQDKKQLTWWKQELLNQGRDHHSYNRQLLDMNEEISNRSAQTQPSGQSQG